MKEPSLESLTRRLDRLERKVPGWTLPSICAVVGLLVVGCGVAATLTASRELSPTALGRAAVMPFGGYRSDVFADLVTHELLAVGVTVVERSRLAEVLAEQNLRLDDLAAGKGDVQRIGRALDADVLVFGSVSPITVYLSGAPSGKVSAASVRFVSVATGEVLASASFSSNTDLLPGAPTYPEVAHQLIRSVIRR